jgi:hypothetical protein
MVLAADAPHLRGGVVRGAEGARGHQGGAAAGEVGDAMEACGLDGLGQCHGVQDRRLAGLCRKFSARVS